MAAKAKSAGAGRPCCAAPDTPRPPPPRAAGLQRGAFGFAIFGASNGKQAALVLADRPKPLWAWPANLSAQLLTC